jgi:hypothetical protein
MIKAIDIIANHQNMALSNEGDVDAKRITRSQVVRNAVKYYVAKIAEYEQKNEKVRHRKEKGTTSNNNITAEPCEEDKLQDN